MAVADDPTSPSCGSKLSAALATLTAYRSSIKLQILQYNGGFNTTVEQRATIQNQTPK